MRNLQGAKSARLGIFGGGKKSIWGHGRGDLGCEYACLGRHCGGKVVFAVGVFGAVWTGMTDF